MPKRFIVLTPRECAGIEVLIWSPSTAAKSIALSFFTLSFAARNEAPYISKHIADVMFQIENLKNVSNVLAISDKIMKDLEEEN